MEFPKFLLDLFNIFVYDFNFKLKFLLLLDLLFVLRYSQLHLLILNLYQTTNMRNFYK